MTLASVEEASSSGYDRVARWVHWVVAILAVIVVTLGWAMVQAPRNSSSRDSLLLLHRSLGLTILALMVFRAFWRGRRPPPPLPASVSGIESLLAHLTHWILYLLFIAMPLTGYLNAASAGHAVSVFGLFAIPPLIPENNRLSQVAIALHLVGQYLVYGFVALHVAAALMHGLVRRDGVLELMLPAWRWPAARRRGSSARTGGD